MVDAEWADNLAHRPRPPAGPSLTYFMLGLLYKLNNGTKSVP